MARVLRDGPNAAEFAGVIADLEDLAVPSITLFEVFKRIRVQRDAHEALRAVAHMKRGRVIDLDGDLAIMAADVSAEMRLPLADSVILVTALVRPLKSFRDSVPMTMCGRPDRAGPWGISPV